MTDSVPSLPRVLMVRIDERERKTHFKLVPGNEALLYQRVGWYRLAIDPEDEAKVIAWESATGNRAHDLL